MSRHFRGAARRRMSMPLAALIFAAHNAEKGVSTAEVEGLPNGYRYAAFYVLTIGSSPRIPRLACLDRWGCAFRSWVPLGKVTRFSYGHAPRTRRVPQIGDSEGSSGSGEM